MKDDGSPDNRSPEAKMTLDGFVIAAVVAELAPLITRGRVQKVRQHNDTDLTLEIRIPGHTCLLFVSADSRFPRVHLTSARLPSPQQPPQFCMVLRKYAEGAAVRSVEQAGMDRIVKFHLDSSEHGRLTLIAEMMGKHSNAVLINPEMRILGAAKHIGATVSRYRQVFPGREYLPPPGADKADIRRIGPADFDSLWDAELPELAIPSAVREWLTAKFAGFGPFAAAEVAARAVEGTTCRRERVREGVFALSGILSTGRFEPVLITDERGTPLMAYPFPSVQFPPEQQHPRESFNETLDTLYRSLVSRTKLEEEREQLLTAIRRAMAARQQTLKSIERTLSESARAERYKQLGEILISNLHAIRKGDTIVRLPDYFDPEAREIEIELDGKLSPQENAERYFRRYQKARDAAESAFTRRNQALDDLRVLEQAQEEACRAPDTETLRGLREALTNRELLRTEFARPDRQEDLFGGHRIRRVVTPEGWEILYGTTSQANDYLTQKIARPNDVWLHARAVTGAHVVIRTAGQPGPVPRSVLMQAAEIAARNSEARHSSLVPVDYTLKKYVRKPRGSAPGFVLYTHEKTIDVAADK